MVLMNVRICILLVPFSSVLHNLVRNCSLIRAREIYHGGRDGVITSLDPSPSHCLIFCFNEPAHSICTNTRPNFMLSLRPAKRPDPVDCPMNNAVGKLNQINLMDVLSEHLSQNRSLSSYSITRGLNTILNLFWKITWTSVSLFKIFNYNSEAQR